MLSRSSTLRVASSDLGFPFTPFVSNGKKEAGLGWCCRSILSCCHQTEQKLQACPFYNSLWKSASSTVTRSRNLEGDGTSTTVVDSNMAQQILDAVDFQRRDLERIEETLRPATPQQDRELRGCLKQCDEMAQRLHQHAALRQAWADYMSTSEEYELLQERLPSLEEPARTARATQRRKQQDMDRLQARKQELERQVREVRQEEQEERRRARAREDERDDLAEPLLVTSSSSSRRQRGGDIQEERQVSAGHNQRHHETTSVHSLNHQREVRSLSHQREVRGEHHVSAGRNQYHEVEQTAVRSSNHQRHHHRTPDRRACNEHIEIDYVPSRSSNDLPVENGLIRRLVDVEIPEIDHDIKLCQDELSECAKIIKDYETSRTRSDKLQHKLEHERPTHVLNPADEGRFQEQFAASRKRCLQLHPRLGQFLFDEHREQHRTHPYRSDHLNDLDKLYDQLVQGSCPCGADLDHHLVLLTPFCKKSVELERQLRELVPGNDIVWQENRTTAEHAGMPAPEAPHTFRAPSAPPESAV